MTNSSALRPAVFFDRDGVINASPGESTYVLRWADFHFLPDLLPVLEYVKSSGFLTVLVTNQQCVGRGLLDAAGLQEIHDSMQSELGSHCFDAIECCPHLSGTCNCRKPSPEMILNAARLLGVDLKRSWMVGDHDRDIEMANRAGIPKTVRFLSEKSVSVPARHTVKNHRELLEVFRQGL
jgi:histidinol-phosphate phosphatase family protein